MNFEFTNKELIKLYKKGKSKKYKLEDHLVKKFIMVIQKIIAAVNIHDLRKTASLNFEKLKG
ncbi:MAG: type II toxin-antitoxin system RelE/ParE family toxin, partial [Planctomycetes bacterium]|nr:type II toxin-antitoxin system RelE/ParE family toxin [Planctomycetota bacterium]